MMIADLARKLPPDRVRSLGITGVDKFLDEPAEDWEPGNENKSWQEACGDRAPSFQAAQELIKAHCPHLKVELVQERAEFFLSRPSETKYDWIYIDASHDYESTAKLIELSRCALGRGGVLSGDDYIDKGRWGVKSAVNDLLPGHLVWDGWIWYAQLGQESGCGQPTGPKPPGTVAPHP